MKKGQKSKKESCHQRVAAIDIGTHSTRFMILESKPSKSPQIKVLEQGGEITRLGKNLHQTGKLQKSAREATLKTIKKFHKKIISKKVTQMAIFGTSALREAKNGRTFAREVKKATGTHVSILKGSQESQLAHEGMLASFPRRRDNPITLDIGGGSTEIVFKDAKKKVHRLSFKVGAVRLHEAMKNQSVKELRAYQNIFVNEKKLKKLPHRTWVGAGGTITTLAAIDLKLKKYHPNKIHGHKLTTNKIEALFLKLQQLSQTQRKKIVGLEPKRADIIVPGTAILLTLLHLARAPPNQSK